MVDPASLYGTDPPQSQGRDASRNILTKGAEHTVEDTSEADSETVDEADLGGFAQLSVVEAMLDRGQGLEAGLQGVAMTR